MFKTTEIMSVKQFMNGDYHMDAMVPMLTLITGTTLPAFLAFKVSASSMVAYKALFISLFIQGAVK